MANADIPGVSRTDYGYDWVGNRTSPTAVYNDADQLTSYNGNTYTYYGEGGMINGAGRTFGYIPTGDPYQVSLNGVSKNGAFESHGLREVTYGATTTKYSYDITASTPAMITEGPNDGTTTYYYVREPDGELIMRKNGTDYKYYHFDELGSTLFLTNASGIQTDKYVYDAWGKVVSSSGSTVNPYRYIGQYGYYYDTETNLYLLGKRYYDADAGVFCQRDTEKDGLSYYSYTSGNVMTATDPWGEAYMIWKDKRLCLYHDNGKVWKCCNGKSGNPGNKDKQPIAPGMYRLNPRDITHRDPYTDCKTDQGDGFTFKPKENWGMIWVPLKPVMIRKGCAGRPHSACFIHGGNGKRPGTAGCIRIPDAETDHDPYCLDILMGLVNWIGTPIKVIIQN